MHPIRSRRLALLPGSTALLTLGLFLSPVRPALAGNLNACDEARVAVREAIAAAYRPVLAEVDKRSPPADAAAPSTPVQATRSDLERQEASDFGAAVKRIEGDCRGGLPPVAEIAKSATDLADRGIASVLAAHGMTADLGASPRSP